MAHSNVRTLAFAAAAAVVSLSQAEAHCFVGGRFMPATLNVDDPCVADEMSLPTVSSFNNGSNPAARETDVATEFSKRVTETFGVSVAQTWVNLHPPGGPAVSGFQNFETTFKSQFYTDPVHELVLSAALSVEWGGTGSKSVGADSFSTLTPTVYFGKGFGDLPDRAGWVRAFAVTGQVGYSVPLRSSNFLTDPDTGLVTTSPNPQVLHYGGTLQYSMPYLKSSIVDLGLPDFINRLVPLVEINLATPVGNNGGNPTTTIGTINPGVIWVGDNFQVGAEAIVPVNRASGSGIGGIAQLHIFLDDLFPKSIGKPLLSSN